MLVLAKEHLVGGFENASHFYTDRQHDHWHDEGTEDALPFSPSLTLVPFDYFGNLNEQLLHVEGIEGQWIEVAEDPPVGQVARQTD